MAAAASGGQMATHYLFIYMGGSPLPVVVISVLFNYLFIYMWGGVAAGAGGGGYMAIMYLLILIIYLIIYSFTCLFFIYM